MLQRAASNAYSWWWASQIRTKQSKWLANDLQEMEDRVKIMIKLIDEDADSFAKKAEMYFRRRPELISIVEETFRAYKALADRYDRLSGELHNANHTIATAFPDQVPMLNEENNEDDDVMSLKPILSLKLPSPPPELPRPRTRRAEAAKRPLQLRRTESMTPDQAQQEIDRLQKRILGLQTEKEFCKSSYESGLAKYWDIEQHVTELQHEISQLQDEFLNPGSVIEDDEARALVASTVLKSCEDSLAKLHDKQKKSSEEAATESVRVRAAKWKLKQLKGEVEETDAMSETAATSSTVTDEEYDNLKHDRFELQSICDKVKDLFDKSSETALAELVKKIDQLVEKVINLEITISTQTAQIQTLRAENDEFHKHLREVEEEKKSSSLDPTTLNQRLTQVEEQLNRILDLERNVQNEKILVSSHFAEACCSLNQISDKLQSPDQNDSLTRSSSSGSSIEGKVSNIVTRIETKEIFSDQDRNDQDRNEDELLSPDWEKLLASGLEGKDKIMSYEYTSILRSYKDTRKKLAEMAKNHEEYQSDTTQQIQELRCENAIKDEEIKSLRKKLLPEEEVMVDALDTEPAEEEEEQQQNVEELCTPSPMEEKFRADIDTLLDDNLDFWLRFSTSYHQIQNFSSQFKHLREEAKNMEDSNNDASNAQTCKKLRDLNTELQVWLEKNKLLQGQLQSRSASLCSIQEEITRATAEDHAKFTPYQAAKFQGEVINMQGENNKVAKELQTGLDHVKGVQSEVAKILSQLQPQYNRFRNVSTRSNIPLKTFLFAAKTKKHSRHHSLFSCMPPIYRHRRHHSDMELKNQIHHIDL